ncbi:MAG: hypothetical protein AAF498_06980, partial [Pseudomonadota bacterium]
RKSATWRTREGARPPYSMTVVRPAAREREDPVPSNGVARGGGPRPPPETGLSAPWPTGIPPRILLAR